MKRIIILAMIIVTVSVLTIGTTYCSDLTGTSLLSPALKIIANDNGLVKSEINGNKIVFSADDFKEAIGSKELSSVEIKNVPDPACGKLMLGSLEVFEGQKISKASLSSLFFVPKAGVKEAVFDFIVDENEYSQSCTVYYLDGENYAPTSAGIDESYYFIETYKNIAVFGKMRCDDPEGDAVKYEITKRPEKGLLTLINRSTGEYSYTPSRNFTGKDGFSYVATDKYGNRSAEITVDVWVSASDSGVVFRDLIGDASHKSAINLHDAGIMSGTEDSYGDVYLPNMRVYYGDFLKMALKAAGITSDSINSNKIAEDLKSIPSEYRSAVSKAYTGGLIDEEDVKNFDCTEYVTKAEACVIVNNILDLSPSKTVPTFSDVDKIPDDALDAVCALINAGVMITDNGEVSANESLKRSDAAILLCEILNRK